MRNYPYNNRQRGNRQVDINNLFIEVYQAYPAVFKGRDDIELSNSILLPPKALAKLSLMKNFNDTKNPILFRILNIDLGMYTHCGVADFTAENGKCYLPSNMFDKLCLEEGQKVNVRCVPLKPGTFIKLQPHKTEFINNPKPKTILEFNLRNYFCVTEGDTISVKFGKKIYKIDVVQCKPEKAIRTLNCDIEVDFDPPKDYKEPEKKPKKEDSSSLTGSALKFKTDQERVLSKEEIQKKITDKKFSGHHIRIDGKEVSNQQAKKIIKGIEEQKKNNEENYDPRKCRIPTNPRPMFKYVEL